jgi:DNA invertase Pin-like site-specific DNA recombinase
MAHALAAARRRAIGIIRVSHVGKRKGAGERFVSPREQLDRIRTWCASQGIDLVASFEELDISGGLPLDRRPGLLPAIEQIERGQADLVVVAYFDRLVRSLRVQSEVLERVEGAGGIVVTLDVGEVSTATAASWLNATMHGMMAEYQRRQTREKTAEAKFDAVARGVPPFPRIPFGYRRGSDGRLVIEPAEAAGVRQAFERRAAGASVGSVLRFLREHGFQGSLHAVQTLLATRVVLGEIHFGKLVNTTAHEPIIEHPLWQRVQKVSVPRGRRSVSKLLLARLGVLRCGSCGCRLTVAYFKKNAGQDTHWVYRCSSPAMHRPCVHPVTIKADLIEPLVVDETKRLLSGASGSASVSTDVTEAEADNDRAHAMLNAATEAFDGLNAASTREKLQALQQTLDETSERLERLRAAAAPSKTITVSGDWAMLTHDEQRALIRAVLREVRVLPGRGAERVQLFPQ